MPGSGWAFLHSGGVLVVDELAAFAAFLVQVELELAEEDGNLLQVGVDAVEEEGKGFGRLPAGGAGRAEGHQDQQGAPRCGGKNGVKEDGGRDGCEEGKGPEAAAKKVLSALGLPELVRGVAEAAGDFGVGVACAGGALPVLAKSGHVEIVAGHGLVDVEDASALGSHAAAEFGLLAGDEGRVVSIDLLEGAATHKDVSAAVIDDAGCVNPVEIEDAVVESPLGVNLAAVAPDGDDVGGGLNGLEGVLQEAWVENGIAVEEEDEVGCGGSPACVAAEGGGGMGGGYGEDGGSGGSGEGGASVG